MKKKLRVLLAAAVLVLAASGCGEGVESVDGAFENYYAAAGYNETINLTVDFAFSDEEVTSENHAESLIKVCGNEMSYETNAQVTATTEEDPITNTIKGYVYNDALYYDVNGSKVKENRSVKETMYMLGIDHALIDESYCASIDYSVENGAVHTVYAIKPEMAVLNWENTFYTLYYGLGVEKDELQTVDKCNLETIVKDGRLLSYVIDFEGDVGYADKTVHSKYRMQLDYSDYGKTKVTPLENLEEYREQDTNYTDYAEGAENDEDSTESDEAENAAEDVQ